jgi:hypothetical protein
VVAEGLGDVGVAGETEQADHQVSEGGHDLGAAAGAGLVQAHLDGPVALDPGGQFGGVCLLGGQGADRVGGLAALTAFAVGLLLVRVDRAGGAGDLDGLRGVREPEPGRDGDDPEGALLDLSVATAGGGVCPTGTSFQGSAFNVACRVGWLPFTVTSRCAPRACR